MKSPMEARVARSDGTNDATVRYDKYQPPQDVVLPPKDVRAIIEKTAMFVARNGQLFQERVREREKTNPKFSFLIPSDAYEAFYLWRLGEIKAGRYLSDVNAQTPTLSEKCEVGEGAIEPMELKFSGRVPSMSGMDFDVLTLSAVFVAKIGKVFMRSLLQRAAGNSQFDFARPQHSLYQLFSRLVDQCMYVLNCPAAQQDSRGSPRIADLLDTTKLKGSILSRAKRRARLMKMRDRHDRQLKDADEQEKSAYALVDWHDFSVVEVVEFSENQRQSLQSPISLSHLQTASLEQKATMSLGSTSRPFLEPMADGEVRQESVEKVRAGHFKSVWQGCSASDATPQRAVGFGSLHVPVSEKLETTPLAHQPGDVSAQPSQPKSQENIDRAKFERQLLGLATCPYCCQGIPLDQIRQHVKVELQCLQMTQQSSKQACNPEAFNHSTSEVVNSLKRPASQRSDVTESEQESLSGPQNKRPLLKYLPQLHSYGLPSSTSRREDQKDMEIMERRNHPS